MSKLKILIKRAFNTKNSLLLSMTLTITFVCVLSMSYALFTASAERKGALNIVSGNLYSLVSSPDINEEKAITIKPGRTRVIRVKLINPNGIEAKFNFYYSATSSNIEIGYNTTGDPCPSQEGITLPKNGDDGDTQSYTIQITNNDSSPVTITFGSAVGLTSQELSFPSGKNVIPQYKCKNKVIDVNGLPTNKCEDIEYNDEDADKSAMFIFTQNETEQVESTTEYRYIGDEPNNYVTFNGEEAGWRIIGVFNVQSAATGSYEQRIKIMRDSILPSDGYNGYGISWDNTYTADVNDWENSALKDLLNNENGIYWKRQSGNCPHGKNNETTTCNFTSVGLTSEAQSMIGPTKWYLGATEWADTNTTTGYYDVERSTTQGGAKGDTSWVGKVGLMYPSDFGFTYAKGASDGCYNTPSDKSKCGQANAIKGWMWAPEKSSTENHNNWYEWAISPNSNTSNSVFAIYLSGFVDYTNTFNNIGVRPVVYLKSNVQINGNVNSSDDAPGSKNNPYTLSES